MCDNHTCDLCGLDIGAKPFYLESTGAENAGRRLQFCCEGCQGIWQMLHEDDPPPPAPLPKPGG